MQMGTRVEGRLATPGEEVGEVVVGEDGAELVAHPHVAVTLREGRAGDEGGPLRDGGDGPGPWGCL